MQITHKHYDIIVIGGGAGGLYTAQMLSANGFNVCCVSKTFPLRSHTISATTGISAACDNMGDGDRWEYQYIDTMQTSAGLADHEAVEFLCKQGPSIMQELSSWGAPFSRLKDGKLMQKFGEGHHIWSDAHTEKAKRLCFAEKKTGHAILHTLYQQCLRQGVQFLNEHLALDICLRDKYATAAVWDMCAGELLELSCDNIILATGGAGHLYAHTSASSACTGDAQAMILRLGLPLQNMEFVQWHALGVYPWGHLLNDADLLSNGACLKYEDGSECDLRGKELLANHNNPLNLDISRLSNNDILPDLCQISGESQINVAPTVSSTLGGIPTNIHGQVLDAQMNPVRGIFAIGECACPRIHGAERLIGNTLLAPLVFGQSTGRFIVETAEKCTSHKNMNSEENRDIWERFEDMQKSCGNENTQDLIDTLRKSMTKYAGNVKSRDSLCKLIEEQKAMSGKMGKLSNPGDSMVWNTCLMDMLELDNMLLNAKAMATCMMNRQETRGMHIRSDYPNLDENFNFHQMVWREGENFHTSYIEVKS